MNLLRPGLYGKLANNKCQEVNGKYREARDKYQEAWGKYKEAIMSVPSYLWSILDES